jgi:chaperonin GroEL (HSP60 family)
MDDVLRGILEGHARSLQRLEAAVRQLAAEDLQLGERLTGAVQRVSLIRYDAFEDVGGRLSFSCALLDERGDGVVVTSINGRQDTRVYAKPVVGGASEHNLSEEEVEAIRDALGTTRQTVEAG